jgi:hypothetical protein
LICQCRRGCGYDVAGGCVDQVTPFLWAYLLVQRNLSLDTQNQLILVLGSDWMDDENI